MYREEILSELKKKKIEIGDRIEIKTPEGKFIGMLMPRPSFGKKDAFVLKLENGYNIGISSKEAVIKLVEKFKPKKTEPADESKGEISVIGCGGTIASRVEYHTGAVYPSIKTSELRAAFPELDKISSIKSEQLFSLFSEDMNSHHWKILAEKIESEIKEGSKGIVVMHGTDTMGYTSAAMSFMLQNLPVPVVLVGAQRSSDRPSSENKMNLLNAVFSAKQDLGEVGVCMHATTNDDFCYLHRGTKVRKMHSSRRDAFHSINAAPMAMVDYRKNMFEGIGGFKKRAEKGKLKTDTRMNDNVALVYSHPNIKPEFIKSLDGYDGVVVAGTGLGHVPVNAFENKKTRSILKPIKELVDSGIPVVMSSQTIYGRLSMRVYTTGRMLIDAGVIGDGTDWTPETAYVKLCWVLGREKKMEKIKELMEKNTAGEISERTPLEVW